jgi:hypothetical protein
MIPHTPPRQKSLMPRTMPVREEFNAWGRQLHLTWIIHEFRYETAEKPIDARRARL